MPVSIKNTIRLKLFVLLIALLIFGCDEKMTVSTQQNTNLNQIHTDIGILNKLISLPKEPISVRWELDESPERDNGSLNVLLEFTNTDKKFILNNSDSFEKQQNDLINTVFYQNWLPEKSKKGIRTKAIKNNYELLNVIPLQPNLFNKTDLSPYVNGSITPLSNGFIFLSLYAM